MDLKLGIQGETSAVVTEEKTAAAVGSGDLPVFCHALFGCNDGAGGANEHRSLFGRR